MSRPIPPADFLDLLMTSLLAVLALCSAAAFVLLIIIGAAS